MSSRIVTDEQLSATPMLWRLATAVSGGEAQRETSKATQQAREEAFAQGVNAGRLQAEQQILPALQGLTHAIEELSRLRGVVREEAMQELVHLAISIAARVIHREVAVDPDSLSGLIRAAFLKLQSREINRVRMHPVLEVLVRKSLEQSGSPRNLVLMPDPGLKAGEVFFETSQGVLDASVETQLREIERGLIDKLER